MKYAKDTRPKGVANKAAEVLVEALPWIKNITGKTVVIKYGGSAMVDEQLRADVMNDIVLLKIVGVNPVIVHGGGKAITALLEAKCFSAITVMIQREVARRICAPPGSPDYGAFSVFCQYHAHTELLFDVPPDCFLPAPKVTSSVLRMVPKAPPAEVDDEAHFFRVVRAAFAQRRKTLANSLSASLGGSCGKQAVARAIEACGLPAAVRGERLSISEFAALSRALRREEAASTSE